jgi:hypothetical protein
VALAAANIAGIRTLVVHAKDERTRGFYEHLGFRPSPSDPLHLLAAEGTTGNDRDVTELKARGHGVRNALSVSAISSGM